jgi:hypothetical protein
MKKCLFILTLLTTYQLSYAQKIITNREAFDFEVGDIFQYKIKSLSLNPDYIYTYRQDVIIKKWFNERKDSVFYNIKNMKSPLVKMAAYGPLDSPVVGYYFRTCKPDASTFPRCFDSTYISDGLKTSMVRYSGGLSGFYFIFSQGLGIITKSSGCDAGCTSYLETLIYYKKSTQSKGTQISDIGLSNYVVFPNPAASTVHIVSNPFGSFDKVWVTDISGRIILKIDKILYNQCDLPLKDINNGLYFLFMYNEGLVKEMKRLVIQH